MPTIDHATAHALLNGRHGDPFAVLGSHKQGRARTVTALDTGAEEMWAVRKGKRHKLDRVEHGIFSGKVPGSDPYTLRGRSGDHTFEYEDAYRFGPVITPQDEYLFAEGTLTRLWKVCGAHVMEHEGARGTHFAVWAPNAARVSVVGDFNAWNGIRHVMRKRGSSGLWEIFVPGIGEGAHYKYEIVSGEGHVLPWKADPVGFGSQHPPATASVVRDISGYGWKDAEWMETRAQAQRRDAPISVYEVHLGSWRRVDGRRMSYREAAEELIDYVAGMGFTHIELMPISEYPFDGSWGYQPVGLYAPTIRFGPPHEFRDLVEAAHAKNIGVLIDWVPGHFPTDEHGLARFDGTALYEHADPREGFHMDWNTYIYNYGRREVANFLVSNGLYWLDEYHADGLRVDAVASMVYRDYSRQAGEWVPNKDGGRENYEAISVLQRTNTLAYAEEPGIMTVAEESTAFPGVSAPVDHGGLGFGYKWNMGWMNDTLEYMAEEPINRRWHHHKMTFGLHYAFTENFVLPISHDEVVHGKGSMIRKMPGEGAEKFAHLRAYYSFMWGHPGKKLLFMGCEIAQWAEWNHDAEIDWPALQDGNHKGVQSLVRDLNRLYRDTPALHVKDCEPEGFAWLEANAADESVYAWARFGREGDEPVVVVCNFTPVERRMRIAFPHEGRWREALNSDASLYGGGDRGNMGGVDAEAHEWNGQPASAEITVPPLAGMFFVAQRASPEGS